MQKIIKGFPKEERSSAIGVIIESFDIAFADKDRVAIRNYADKLTEKYQNVAFKVYDLGIMLSLEERVFAKDILLNDYLQKQRKKYK